jgi:hypothetical protein
MQQLAAQAAVIPAIILRHSKGILLNGSQLM